MPATVTGVTKTNNNLRRSAQALNIRAVDEAGLDSMQILADATNARAPRPSLRNGAVARKVRGTSGRREYWVAFRRGMPMRIAHLVELGTAPHSLAPGASRRDNYLQDVPPFHPGTRPEPFFTPAYEATKEDVVQTFGLKIWNVLSKIALSGR